MDTFYSRESKLVPAQISAGASRLALQLEPYGGPWQLRAGDSYLNGADLGPAESLSLSRDEPTTFAAVTDGTYGLQDLTRRAQTEWQPLPAGPVSSLQADGPDYVLVSWPRDAQPGEPPPAAPLLAHVLAEGRNPQLLTTFPAGTTSTSFAADVDTVP